MLKHTKQKLTRQSEHQHIYYVIFSCLVGDTVLLKMRILI